MSADRGTVLFVLTNHDRLGEAGDQSAERTGFHLAEAAHPWQVLIAAGFDVALASPLGGVAPIDPSSADLGDPVARAFLADNRMQTQVACTLALASLNLHDYKAIYFPGGHGTMWDLPHNGDVQKAVLTAYDNGMPVAAVCHGPAALVNVKLADGSWLVEGKTVSAFTDEEEIATAKQHLMPFSLGSTLIEHGAIHHKAANFEAAVSVHDGLITGQNPASARGVGEAIRDLLQAKVATAL